MASSAAERNKVNHQRGESKRTDPQSLFAWYKNLIRLKKTVPAFEHGANVMLDTENNKVLSWARQAPGAAQVVVGGVNFYGRAADGGPGNRAVPESSRGD